MFRHPLLTSLMLCTACGSQPPQPLAQTIQVSRLTSHLESLKSMGKPSPFGVQYPGVEASMDYIERHLKAAGVRTYREPFVASKQRIHEVSLTGPGGERLPSFAVPSTGHGEVTGELFVTDNYRSACTLDQFDAMSVGQIALIRKSTSCTVATQTANAYAAGAAGVLLYKGPLEHWEPTLSSELGELPVAEVMSNLALQLRPNQALTLEVQSEMIEFQGSNLFAEIPGSADQNLLLGAHVNAEPGASWVNNNASGSLFLLEAALNAHTAPTYTSTLTFAWWGGQGGGTFGSAAYLKNNPKVSAYLDFNMMASHNGLPFLIDGDGSHSPVFEPNNAGSAAIEAMFSRRFQEHGVTPIPVSNLRATDGYHFVEAGVPTGGVWAGGSTTKTPQQATFYGGEAYQAFDPCYNTLCLPKQAHFNQELYELLSQVSAEVIEELANHPL